jgi:hypothetical protein
MIAACADFFSEKLKKMQALAKATMACIFKGALYTVLSHE